MDYRTESANGWQSMSTELIHNEVNPSNMVSYVLVTQERAGERVAGERPQVIDREILGIGYSGKVSVYIPSKIRRIVRVDCDLHTSVQHRLNRTINQITNDAEFQV